MLYVIFLGYISTLCKFSIGLTIFIYFILLYRAVICSLPGENTSKSLFHWDVWLLYQRWFLVGCSCFCQHLLYLGRRAWEKKFIYIYQLTKCMWNNCTTKGFTLKSEEGYTMRKQLLISNVRLITMYNTRVKRENKIKIIKFYTWYSSVHK